MRRGLHFALLSAACLLLAGGYVAWAAIRDGEDSRPEGGSAVAVPDLRRGGRILFQNVTLDARYATIALVTRTRPRGRRTVVNMVCHRVHFAGGRGLCLRQRRDVLVPSYSAVVLDARLRPQRDIHLPGLNNRARVSPDGRYAAATGFVNGDSYLDIGFSTRSFIIDVLRGTVVNLEDFAVYRNGKSIRSIDFNFWGITFERGSTRFYATLSTRGKIFLVRGDIAKKRLEVLVEDVECPSLSPDNSHIAFKKRIGRGWRLWVLDLRTQAATRLPETRSVDDQAEWLDNDHVLYGLDATVWVVRADGRGKPRKLIPEALSPAVIA